ncbi:MAG: type II secretion system GspH family protein [Phycisphaerae bacterium]|nr:type II secretion system GspH family protein [Phycisphaerae bacterium]
MRSTPEHRRGFSLVEILVVIAIIGVLTSILVPAVGRARGQAQVIACRANLRGLGMASLMYAQDNTCRLPVDPGMLGPSHVSGYTGQWISNPHHDLLTLLKPYVQDSKTYYCPACRTEPYAYSPGNVAKGEIGYLYFSVEKQPKTNGTLPTFLYSPREGDPMVYPRRLLSTMRSETWVVSDLWFSGKGDAVSVAHPWYGKGVNYVTLDGTVRMVRSGPRQVFK